jgi:hypothetical protein
MSHELYPELYEQEHGLYGFLNKSSQPQQTIKRKYKRKPETATIWFSDLCGFGVPTYMVNDVDVWGHEFTENTLASLIKEHTGKSGLKWKFTRWRAINSICEGSEPTVAHFLTSLTFLSGVYNIDRGFKILNGDLYEMRYMKNSTAKPPEGCTRLVRYRTIRVRGHKNAQTFNSCGKKKKNIIRRRVLELFESGMRIGYFIRKDLPPVGICDAILAEFQCRIWTYTIERIIAKYSL